MTFEDIKLYLPRYLSDESRNALIEALRNFPIPSDKFYTTRLRDTKIIYQADGIKDLLFVNLPGLETKVRDGVVLSNTCDISPDNVRLFESRMVYTPIVKLATYRQTLEDEGIKKEKVDQHVDSIKNHHITQIFFLPGSSGILDDSIIFFDRLYNLPSDFVGRESLPSRRIFTLSDAGHYLFLFKLSFHFTRMQDKVERGFS